MSPSGVWNREWLVDHEPAQFTRLWVVATTTYGVGDVVTTLALVSFVPWVREGNLLLRSVVESAGLWGLVAVKLLVFLVAIGLSVYGDRVGDRFLYYLPPVTLSLFGAFVTAFNLRLFLR